MNPYLSISTARSANIMAVPGTPGTVVLSSSPGRAHDDETIAEALSRDVQDMASDHVSIVLTLITEHELETLGLSGLGQEVVSHGIVWAHAPIKDYAPPDDGFEIAWSLIGSDIHRRLENGETVLIHCRAGLGRSGTVAARLLVERGFAAEDAMAWVRQHRPGAIETPEQEAHLHRLAVNGRF